MSEKIMIDVNYVTIHFCLASQNVDNLKEYIINKNKKELIFKKFLAVKDVGFRVRKGAAWTLIGSNGSGKSTLLKNISGIMRPYKGKITLHGSIAPLIELGAGFDAECTARENIYLNGCVRGNSKKYMDEHLMRSLISLRSMIFRYTDQELFFRYEDMSRIFRCNGSRAGDPHRQRSTCCWRLYIPTEMHGLYV